jgi:hypothetical protein
MIVIVHSDIYVTNVTNSELELHRTKISDTTISHRNGYLEEPFEESIPIASSNLLLSEKLSSLITSF